MTSSIRERDVGRAKPATPCQLRNVLVKAVADTGLTKAEIARRSGFSEGTVRSLLSGRNSGKIETWSDILDACNIQVGTREVKG